MRLFAEADACGYARDWRRRYLSLHSWAAWCHGAISRIALVLRDSQTSSAWPGQVELQRTPLGWRKGARMQRCARHLSAPQLEGGPITNTNSTNNPTTAAPMSAKNHGWLHTSRSKDSCLRMRAWVESLGLKRLPEAGPDT